MVEKIGSLNHYFNVLLRCQTEFAWPSTGHANPFNRFVNCLLGTDLETTF